MGQACAAQGAHLVLFLFTIIFVAGQHRPVGGNRQGQAFRLRKHSRGGQGCQRKSHSVPVCARETR